MTYPSMPQYGHAYQQQYGQSLYENYQHPEHSSPPLDYNTPQQQYSSGKYQRPAQPQQPESLCAAPPPYVEQDSLSLYPPPPPPRPTPQPSYGSQSAVRPVSPLPTSEADYRSRLEAAGVTQQQINMILGQQSPPQDLIANNDASIPTAPLQNLSLNATVKAPDTKPQSYPFNLPESAPIVLHDVCKPGEDDNFYIVPPNESPESCLYTGQWFNISDNLRPGLRLQHHKDQDPAYTRMAGSCTYSVQGISLKFPWQDWGEWYQASGTRTQHFNSDTGVLPGKVMYWEKDVSNYHGKPTIFMLRCKVTDQALDDEEKPKPDDRVIVTVDVRVDDTSEPDIITFAPGIIKKQDQLDEMLTIALAVKQKFHWDMVMWFADTNKINADDMSKFNDLSMVPDNVDGWGGEHGINVVNPADAKAAKKARWKERAKLFGASAKLAHQVGQLSMNVAAMNSA